jgi:NAD(P)-dependent dehydrogenase (short-subunit alcohol dehydrogenase family)
MSRSAIFIRRCLDFCSVANSQRKAYKNLEGAMSAKNKVVLITGAGSGIGRALSIGFAGDGDTVLGFDRDGAGLSNTAGAAAEGFTATAGDVTSDTDVNAWVAAAIDQHGRVDVLINNAGIANQGALTERPFADWQAVIDVNLTALARCTYEVLPHMQLARHGRIVNVCSREGETGRRTLSAYSASKAGVATFTKSLARELEKEGQDDVLVFGLIPGGTLTNMNTNPDMQSPEEVYPHTRYMVERPAGHANGRMFFRSQDYEMFSKFNEQRARIPSPPAGVED